jgi:hypothetical protein
MGNDDGKGEIARRGPESQRSFVVCMNSAVQASSTPVRRKDAAGGWPCCKKERHRSMCMPHLPYCEVNGAL